MATNQLSVEVKHGWFSRPGKRGKELKPIRYQYETYRQVTSVINRVNVASLWDAHEY